MKKKSLKKLRQSKMQRNNRNRIVSFRNVLTKGHGLVVKREDLQPRGRGFKSWCQVQDGKFQYHFIAFCDPERIGRRFDSRSDVVGDRLLLVLVPDQEPDVAPANYSHSFLLLELESFDFFYVVVVKLKFFWLPYLNLYSVPERDI